MKFLAYFLFLLSLGCSRILPPEEPCGFKLSFSMQRISWKNNTPIKVRYSYEWQKSWVEALKRAANTWNQAAGRELLQILPSTRNVQGLLFDGDNIVNSEFEWSSSAVIQAYTKVYSVASVIFEADIILNQYDYKFYVNSEDEVMGAVHLESLLLHELGHLLGLVHEENVPSAMSPSLNFNTERTLSESDVANIRCEYAR